MELATILGVWTRAVLALMFAVTLVHTLRGSKYHTVIYLVSLLLIQNVACFSSCSFWG